MHIANRSKNISEKSRVISLSIFEPKKVAKNVQDSSLIFILRNTNLLILGASRLGLSIELVCL